MTDSMKTLAERLVASGYASEMDSKVAVNLDSDGELLSAQKAYVIFVDHEGWQNVDPFGGEPYSYAQSCALEDYAAMLSD